jgi:hypothetical protein
MTVQIEFLKAPTMTSIKQIEANRLNALKSTGPRTEQGKQTSRQNALRHGLTAETVITALENSADYQAFETTIASDYQPRSATECELVSRLASVLWRLRRSTSIETGLFQIQGELMQNGSASPPLRRNVPLPDWYDELDATPHVADFSDRKVPDESPASAQSMAFCFVRISRLGYRTFDLLSRYETALWRQAAQILFMLQAATRR